jgi:hypothetical protein
MSTISVTNINDGDSITAASINNQINTIVNDYNGGITAPNLASNAVTTAKITAANVTDAKLVYGKVRSRQGGSTTNWQTTGTTTYDYSATDTFVQTGSVACTSGAVLVTFPTAFSQIPVVYAQTTSAGTANTVAVVKTITATTFIIYQLVVSSGAGATTETAYWIAVGQ